MKGNAAKMRPAGCDSYISKPIDVLYFAAMVRACPTGANGGVSPVPAARRPLAVF